MSQEEFREQYALASAQIATWPVWKQNILETYASPTVAVPRTPVDNGRIPDEQAKTTKRDD
jgi:hypothetical protein